MISLNIPLSQHEWYRKYIETLNIFSESSSTDKELDVVHQIYLQGGVLTTPGRKAIQKSLKINNLNLNNYVSSLRSKGIILDTDKGVCLHKSLMVILTDPFEIKIRFYEPKQGQ
jgi:hypothetical protein